MSDKKDSNQTQDLDNTNNNSSIDISLQKTIRVDAADAGMGLVAAKRRKLLKAALAAPPVLMTLTSRPVHAVQGLSNMMSGDASQCRGDTRYGGMSPGFWKKLTGTTDLYGDEAYLAWQLTGYEYATPIPAANSGANYDTYSGGTLCSDVFSGSSFDKSLREVLNEESGSDEFHLIAGLLNARYFDAKAAAGGGPTQYFMTTAQFWDMYDERLEVPPGYASLRDLVESNYHGTPGTGCP